MKKLIIAAGIFLMGLSVSAQLTVTGTDVVPVNLNGLQSLMVEKVTPSAAAITAGVPAGSVTYRMFVKLDANYQFLGCGGKDNSNPLTYITIQSTLPFYNDVDNGGASGAEAGVGLYPTTPQLQYDSYLSDGRIGTNRYGVPTSVNANGYIVMTGANPLAMPAAGLQIPKTIDIISIVGATLLYDYNSGWAVPGAAAGPDAATNTVFIGQVTTAGDLNMVLNISLQNPAGNIAYIPHVVYPIAPDLAPTVSVVSPATGASFPKNSVITIGAHAKDDNAVTSVEFFVNGVSIGIDNTDNGQTDVTLPTHTITWTALGINASIYAIATDGVNPPVTSSTVTISISDPHPTNVAISAPVAGSYNLSPISLIATATDGDQTISSVEFLVNGAVVGTDSDGSNGWSILYTPVAASNVNVSARALGVVSSPVIVSFANAAPSVSITAPVAPFNLTVGNDTTFVATATDADGTIASVAFIMGGQTVYTDNSAPFEYVYTASVPGNYSISARATDNLGSFATSTTINFTAVFAAGSGYALMNVADFCSSSDVFCVPVVTTAAVNDVIGYDVEMLYDKSKVTPTGIVIVGEDLIDDRDFTSYSYNIVNDSLIRISIFFNGSAPADIEFKGEGGVFCVEFSRNYNFGNVDTANFTIPLITESYASFVSDIKSPLKSIYRTYQETQFEGSLSFWSDNSPIAYVFGENLITEIYGNATGDNASKNVTPDANGRFVYDVTNGHSITIRRDIANTTDVQSVINGYDAYLTSKVTIEDESFRPNVYQMIAMDVNCDGRVAAGDISQISLRAVARLGQFKQDWIFVPSNTVLTDPSYRISDAYPRPDVNASNGTGYSRNLVPQPSNIIALPILNPTACLSIGTENYKGIMLGDADGSYSSIANSLTLKSAGNEAKIIVDVNNKSVYVSSDYAVNSLDLQIWGENESVEVTSTNGLKVTSNLVANKLAITSYGNVKSTKLAAMTFDRIISVDSLSLAKINGKDVAVEVIATPTKINDKSASAIKVYPNPANDKLFISVETDVNVAIYNMAGIRMLSQEGVNGSSSIDISSLEKGVYVLVVNGNNFSERINIVVE